MTDPNEYALGIAVERDRATAAETELARVREELEAVAPTRHTVSDYDGGDGERTRTCAHLGAWQNERRLRVEAEHQRDELSDHLDRQRIEHDETRGYRHQAELDRDAARSKLAEVERERIDIVSDLEAHREQAQRIADERDSLRSQLAEHRAVVEAARKVSAEVDEYQGDNDDLFRLIAQKCEAPGVSMALNDLQVALVAVDALPAPIESCRGCGRIDSCEPLWPDGRKCCPDCSCKPTVEPSAPAIVLSSFGSAADARQHVTNFLSQRELWFASDEAATKWRDEALALIDGAEDWVFATGEEPSR